MDRVYLFGFYDEDGHHWVTDLTGGSMAELNPSPDDPDEGRARPLTLYANYMVNANLAHAIAILNNWRLYTAHERLHATGDFIELIEVKRVVHVAEDRQNLRNTLNAVLNLSRSVSNETE